jgi:amidase
MARSAGDLRLLFDVLAAPDPAGIGVAHRLAMKPPRHTKLSDFRVLVLDDHPLIPTSTEVRTVLAELTQELTASGVAISRASELLPDLTDAARIYMRLFLAAIAASYPPPLYEKVRELASGVDPADDSLAAERTRGAALSYRDWIEADAVRVRQRQAWAELFTQFDVVLTPPSPTAAFPHDQSADQWTRTLEIDGSEYPYPDQLVWSGIASATGLPATVAPIGRTRDGLPIGVQIIGPMYEDLTALRFAAALEHSHGGFSPPPFG